MPSQGGAPVANDANTIIQLTFQESATPWTNHGNGAALSFTWGSQVSRSTDGKFPGAFGATSPTAYACSQTGTNSGGNSSTGAAGTTTNENAFPISAHAWVYPTGVGGSTNNTVFMKAYRPDASGWTSPFVAFKLGLNTNMSPEFYLTTSATLRSITNTNYRIPLNTWSHLALTYDGTTFKGYVNGWLFGSLAETNAIDYGTHGPWVVGGTVANSTESMSGLIADVRFDNVARSQSYFQSIFSAGTNLDVGDVLSVANIGHQMGRTVDGGTQIVSVANIGSSVDRGKDLLPVLGPVVIGTGIDPSQP